MGPELLVIAHAGARISVLQTRYGAMLEVAAQWPVSGGLPSEVLIVDLAEASAVVWDHLERLSPQTIRPSIILLDHAPVPRERLATVVADALLPSDADAADIIATIDAHRSEHAFRAAALAVRDSDIPHPLNRFLVAAFTQPTSKLKLLAVSLSISESTLRSQWRKSRSDPTLRLPNGHERGLCSASKGPSGPWSQLHQASA